LYLTVAEAASELGVTSATIRAQAGKGKIATVKRGRDLFVHRDETARYRIESQLGKRNRRRVLGEQPSPEIRSLAQALGVAPDAAELHKAVNHLASSIRPPYRGGVQRLLRTALTLILSLEHDRALSAVERSTSKEASLLIERVARTIATRDEP
jgi:excisionase family DNA binding protein